jgi:hypothetical protein
MPAEVPLALKSNLVLGHNAEKPEQWILTVKRYAHDGGGLVVRCPHCKDVIGVEGDEGDDIRGEQFQHRSKRCDGWLEVWSQARRVAEV